MFKAVVYHPDESQLLTAGSDRKITYWDCYDGQAIRMLDGSDSGELNALAIYAQGEHFISSGNDKIIKLWDYDEGITYFQGIGHSGNVTKVSEGRMTQWVSRVSDRVILYYCRLPSHRTKNSS